MDSLRVLVKAADKELLLSPGEGAFIFAGGVGGNFPAFALVATDDLIEVSASHAEGFIVSKLPPGFEKPKAEASSLWDQDFDGNP